MAHTPALDRPARRPRTGQAVAGLSERGIFRQHYQTDDLDASLLLLLLMAFLPPSDKRMQDTVVAIADELTENDLVLRYRVTGTDTGFVVAPASRLDRRKARTRQALIEAAARLIAEGPGEGASIQEITDKADIGFGRSTTTSAAKNSCSRSRRPRCSSAGGR